MGDELWRRSACEMVDLLKAGDVTPAEAIDSAAARVEATNGAVNSFVTGCFDRARDVAKDLAASGHPDDPGPGYLYGLPVTIKDLDDVAGVRTTYGSPIFADHVPEQSSLMVQTLERNAGIVIGKTNTPEFGAGANTFNEVFGATRNPWDTRMNCGGSSGGAAVNVATGQSWLATGSDLGGSLRIPAAYNSVVGLRPAPGRCPHAIGPTQFSPLPVCGPIARNVPDVALMLDAMVGWWPRDPISLPLPEVPFRTAAAEARPPKKVAWSASMGIAPVEPEIEAICARAAASFADLGATVADDVCPDLSDGQKLFQDMRAELFVIGRQALLEQHREKLKPEVIWNIEKGMQMSLGQAAAAHRAHVAMYQRMCDFFEDFDLLITPTVMAAPRNVEIRYLEEVNGTRFDNYVDWLMHTYVITLTTCPAISVPCGFTESGLPVGLQLIAPPRGEAALLSAAAAFEQTTGIAARVPMDPVVRH
jgi:amidase